MLYNHGSQCCQAWGPKSVLVFRGVATQPWRKPNGQTKGYGGWAVLAQLVERSADEQRWAPSLSAAVTEVQAHLLGLLEYLVGCGLLGTNLAGSGDGVGLRAATSAILDRGTRARCEVQFIKNVITLASKRGTGGVELVAGHRGSAPKRTKLLTENSLTGQAAFIHPHRKDQGLGARNIAQLHSQPHACQGQRKISLTRQGLHQTGAPEWAICWS